MKVAKSILSEFSALAKKYTVSEIALSSATNSNNLYTESEVEYDAKNRNAYDLLVCYDSCST